MSCLIGNGKVCFASAQDGQNPCYGTGQKLTVARTSWHGCRLRCAGFSKYILTMLWRHLYKVEQLVFKLLVAGSHVVDCQR